MKIVDPSVQNFEFSDVSHQHPYLILILLGSEVTNILFFQISNGFQQGST